MSGANRSFALPAWAKPWVDKAGPVIAPVYPTPMSAAEWHSAVKNGMELFFPNNPRSFRRVLMIIEDSSRPSNTAPVIRYLTEHLQNFLSEYSVIHLLVAGGAHTGLENSNARKIPSDFPGIVKIHDCRDACPAGDVDGIPLYLAREVMEADLRIAIGTINLHPKAGFSGGAKILTPGCAGLPTIFGLHNLEEGQPGVLDTPIRRFAHGVLDRYPVDFAIQLLTDEEGRILQVFTGELRQAWQAAAERLLPWVSLPLPSPFLSCLADTSPFDQNFLGIFKALPAVISSLEPGGTGYILAPAPQGLGGHRWRLDPHIVERERRRWEEKLGDKQVMIMSPAQIPDDQWKSIFPVQIRLHEKKPDRRWSLLGGPFIRSAPLIRFVKSQS